jgi:putative transposase
VINERGLRVLQTYIEYYRKSRTHFPLDKDAPLSRVVGPSANGATTAIPHLGGLHHRYERCSA